ncbi:taurine catabolism dioxygenase [Hyaloscypha variabilis F]|uniref:Taurine catabolism dioxygenase n=1 Tax=Hyaloscypha variabilis (strain UAMH 11265 / GT02V1 / F) TaxID=1149755 RepID=A0A2J6S862_HYAVF|nr:taurine catabolism dioxygenase [Hyaloscypha variabilis F]
MPGLHSTDDSDFKIIRIQKLHQTFGAQVSGVDFSNPIPDETFDEILAAITKYGVLVFRSTALDDNGHVEFARRFGELDDIKTYIAAGRKNRLASDELFDVSNVNLDGTVVDPESPKGQANKGNGIFHVDSSFNPRRASYSLLLAHELPPRGTGGNTAFADTRRAFDDLPQTLKEDLLRNDYIVNHSLAQSQNLGAPDFFAKRNPSDYPMARHRLVQIHEPSGEMNLYTAAHAHHIEGIKTESSKELLDRLFEHATQPKYIFEVEWENVGDLVTWDNTCVMHRAIGGSFEGRYKRDVRRATVHDGSSQAWGLNEHTDKRYGFP